MSNGKGRPRERLSSKQLEEAAKILTCDITRGGEINMARCPWHGKKNLSYRCDDDCIRVFCEECPWQTTYPNSSWDH